MLMLSRRRDESIVINDDIVITVVEIRDNSVRLGFEAPKSIRVNRKEVQDRIRDEGKGGGDHGNRR